MDPETRFGMDLEAEREIYSVHQNLISSAPSLSFKSLAGSATVEQTGPPTPESGLVGNFGIVAKGIYRSQFPHPTNLEHLETLNLRTIVTLVDEPYAPESLQFVRANGINHVRIHILAHKDAKRVNSLDNVARVMEILKDQSQHPVLIHCNKGKHRTGCIIATLRKLNGSIKSDTIKEYLYYAGAKHRDWDEHFIRTLSIPVLAELLRVGPSSLAGKALAAQHFQVTLDNNLAREKELIPFHYLTPPDSEFDEEERWQPQVKWQHDDGTEEEMNPS